MRSRELEQGQAYRQAEWCGRGGAIGRSFLVRKPELIWRGWEKVAGPVSESETGEGEGGSGPEGRALGEPGAGAGPEGEKREGLGVCTATHGLGVTSH